MPAAAIPIAGAIVGGVIGAQKDTKSATDNSFSSTYLAPQSELGQAAQKGQLSNYNSYQDLVNAGANQSDVTSARNQTLSLADMLQQYSQGAFLPNQQDISIANNLSNQLLQPSFYQGQIDANRLASQMGRPINDPVIQAKLRQSQALQQGQMATNFAMQFPQQRLGYAQQLTDVRGALASQAMANRQSILSIGGNILGQSNQMQIAGASHQGWDSQNTSSGGGFTGFAKGAMAGFGSFAGMGGMGGGASPGSFGPQGGGSYFNAGNVA